MKNYNEFINENLILFPFREEIESEGGKIYYVGGKVRDDILGLPSKDIDIIITRIPIDKLISILKKYGHTNFVGASFGVIKFTSFDSKEEIDIAIPRKERKIGKGYQGFEIETDHTLPIEDDLYRRDTTMNAIARDLEGNIIDPYGGVDDIKNRIIRIVNPNAFLEDPLRMIRVVSQASRFGFSISRETLVLIRENAEKIKEISKDRILIEFDKIVKKGKPEIGIELLVQTKLYENIFDCVFLGSYMSFEKVKKLSEFIYLCLIDTSYVPHTFYKNQLEGDKDTTREIKALEFLEKISDDKVNNRFYVSEMIQTDSEVVNSKILPVKVKNVIKELQSGKYPIGLKGLSINGKDLIKLGMKGEQIGKTLDKILFLIYGDKLKNTKEDIMRFLDKII